MAKFQAQAIRINCIVINTSHNNSFFRTYKSLAASTRQQKSIYLWPESLLLVYNLKLRHQTTFISNGLKFSVNKAATVSTSHKRRQLSLNIYFLDLMFLLFLNYLFRIICQKSKWLFALIFFFRSFKYFLFLKKKTLSLLMFKVTEVIC